MEPTDMLQTPLPTLTSTLAEIIEEQTLAHTEAFLTALTQLAQEERRRKNPNDLSTSATKNNNKQHLDKEPSQEGGPNKIFKSFGLGVVGFTIVSAQNAPLKFPTTLPSQVPSTLQKARACASQQDLLYPWPF